MNIIRDKFSSLSAADLRFESLGKLVSEIDFNRVNYHNVVPGPVPGTYSRNILTMEPLEIVVMNWPPGEASAVHLHDGFYGYVAVVEGIMNNTEYSFSGDTLNETSSFTGRVGEVMAERDKVIHRLSNASDSERVITIHFYYPPLDGLNNVRIYDLEKRAIGVLNEKAQSCSWAEPREHFRKIEENAFKVDR